MIPTLIDPVLDTGWDRIFKYIHRSIYVCEFRFYVILAKFVITKFMSRCTHEFLQIDSPEDTRSDILVVRNFWQPETLKLFQTYYINHLYHNIDTIVTENSKYTDTDRPDHHRLQLGRDSLSSTITYDIRHYLCKTFNTRLITGFYYVGFHLPGASLELHTDKQVGEYVVSMPLYTENISKPWRFCVANCDIDLTPGDFVVYDGQIPHHRPQPLADDQFSINIFMLFMTESSQRVIPEHHIGRDSEIFPGKIKDFIQQESK